jgi:ABC-type sugar transport system permease subunit
MKKSFNPIPYIFITPTIILVAVFSYFSMANAVYTSFTQYRSGFVQVFTGLENYKKLFGDRVFWMSFRNQAVMTVTGVFNSCFWPLLAAELLFFIRRRRVSAVIKTAFVVPMLVPGIVTALTWRFLFNNDYGFNTMLESAGLKSLVRNWLNESATAIWCVILVGFPFVSGLYFLILHAGVNNIGSEIYEAAVIDGAGSFQVAALIHIPNLKPYINVIATLSLIGSLTNFGVIAAMTSGGPGNATLTPSMHMYRVAFGNSDLGYASSMGVAILAVVMVFTFALRRILRDKEE